MALFKIEKGLAANLKNNRPNAVEGYCYFTTDDGKFYIDIATGTAKTPAENNGILTGSTRMPINSYMSDWAARAKADVDGNDITSTYGTQLSVSDHTLKILAKDSTELDSVTLPDEKVKQGRSTASNYRALLLHYSHGSYGADPGSATGQVYYNETIMASPSKGDIKATSFTGKLNGNADTATKFASNQKVELTGAVTGSVSSQAGWSIATTLTDGIVATDKIANKAVTNAKLANSSITIGGKSVSLGGSLTLADLGLNSALRFIGQTTTAIVDGGTTSPISVNGSNVTPTIGDVVINSNNKQEYVWLGSNWELLGDESSYALQDHTHDQYLQNAYTSIGANNTMYDAVGATSLNFKSGSGISLSIGPGKNEDYDITITNSGVRSVTSGSTNGTISVNTNGTSNEVAVKGLKSAAYTDESSYVKSISVEEVSGNLTPVLKYTKSNGTTTVGNIDYRVLQSRLTAYGDSYSAASIPVLLSNPAARGNNYTGISYYSEMKYCPDTGYLEGVKIDCGLWESFNGDIDDCCFIAGTQVLIDLDGNTKNIEDIRPGDSAIAYNLTEEKNYSAIVKKVHVKYDVTDVAIVNFENGATLIMNAYHPIYTVNGYHSLTNHNGYDMLLIGDNCRTEKGWSKIISIDRYNSAPITMYSLDVIDINENIDNDINDNFFANGIVVHNASCPS